MTLKSTDNFLLNKAYDYDSYYLKYRDYDTTNIDDNLLPDGFIMPDNPDNPDNNISAKRIRKYLKDRENNLLNEIDQNDSSEDLKRLFEDRDILSQLKHKKQLENDNENEVDEILEKINKENDNIDNEDINFTFDEISDVKQADKID